MFKIWNIVPAPSLQEYMNLSPKFSCNRYINVNKKVILGILISQEVESNQDELVTSRENLATVISNNISRSIIHRQCPPAAMSFLL